MANEVEIERMLVRIVGDSSGVQRAYQQTIAQTKAAAGQVSIAGRGIESGLQPAESAVGNVALRARDAKKSLMLLGAGGLLPPGAAHEVFLAVEGLGMMRTVAGAAAASMGTLKLALIGTGIGAAVVAVGSLAAWLAHMSKEASTARAAAGDAFQTVASGARTTAQAMSDVQVSVMTEGFRELSDTVNPGFWASIWQGLQGMVGMDAIDRAIGRIVTRSRAARDFFTRLNNDPRLQRLQRDVAIQRNTQAVRDLAQAQEELAARSALSERAAARLEAAQRLARESRIGLAEAQVRLAASYDRVDAASRRIDIGRMTLSLRELRDEADRAGMTETTSRIMAMAQEFMRANPSVRTLQEAFRQLEPILNETRRQLNRISMGNFMRSLREQAATMGLSAERAELHRMAMEGVADAEIRAAMGAVRHMEALRGMLAPLERLEGTRAGGVESLARIAEYQRAMTVAIRTGTVRQQLLADQQTALEAPGGVALGGVGAAEAVGGARGRAALMNVPGNINFNPNLPPNAPPAVPQQGAQAQQGQQQVALLGQVLGVLNGILNAVRPNQNQVQVAALAPANLNGGGL